MFGDDAVNTAYKKYDCPIANGGFCKHFTLQPPPSNQISFEKHTSEPIIQFNSVFCISIVASVRLWASTGKALFDWQ